MIKQNLYIQNFHIKIALKKYNQKIILELSTQLDGKAESIY